jgi:hypothetical protein
VASGKRNRTLTERQLRARIAWPDHDRATILTNSVKETLRGSSGLWAEEEARCRGKA